MATNTNEFGNEAKNEAMIERVKLLCPCRSAQVERLMELISEDKDGLACPCIFVNGHTGTGKNHVLKTIMDTFDMRSAFINCIENYSAKLIFETILETVEKARGGDFEMLTRKKCDNFNDFVRNLREILTTSNPNDKKFFIIFKKAERLRSMESNLLMGLMNLAELCNMNVCVILVTEITVENFLSGTGFVIPMLVHFDQYYQKELVKIMTLDCPNGFDETFYATYCQLLVSVFYLACRDLNELKHLAVTNFPKYCKPLEEDRNTDVRKLWRSIEPELKKCLSVIYLREVSSGSEKKPEDHSSKSGKLKLPLELPFLSKYLLIAAFLASNNPSRTDRRFFCKRSFGKMSKRAKTSIKTYLSDGKLTGPKAFPLDRLIAIFFSILGEDLEPNAGLLTQISSLVSLNLLAKVSADDQIDVAKYKCLATVDFIKSITENLEFQLDQYLFDV